MFENFGRLKGYLLAVLACAIALPVAWELDAPSSCFLLAAMVSGLSWRPRSRISDCPGFFDSLRMSFFCSLDFNFFIPASLTCGWRYLSRPWFLRRSSLRPGAAPRNRCARLAKLAQAMRVATLSEFSASVIHEISQPLSAMVANGQTCVRWLSTNPPNVENAYAAAERIVRDGRDAGG